MNNANEEENEAKIWCRGNATEAKAANQHSRQEVVRTIDEKVGSI